MKEHPDNTRAKIAKLLKEYREKSGLTIREAGALLGKSNQTVSAWENGRGQPDADMFLKLCDIYNVPSISLFFGEPLPEPELDEDEDELLKLWREATDEAKKCVHMVLKCNKKQIHIEIKRAARDGDQPGADTITKTEADEIRSRADADPDL